LALTIPDVTVLSRPNGVADGEDPLPDFEPIRVAERRCRKHRLGLDFDDGDIGLTVAADDFGLVFLAGRELHGDLVGIFHDVVVRQDRAVLIDDKPRAQALLAAPRVGAAEKPTPHFLRILRISLSPSLRAALGGRDVDHRGAHPLGQHDKVGQRLNRRGLFGAGRPGELRLEADSQPHQ
jgi:hypothetical protein